MRLGSAICVSCIFVVIHLMPGYAKRDSGKQDTAHSATLSVLVDDGHDDAGHNSSVHYLASRITNANDVILKNGPSETPHGEFADMLFRAEAETELETLIDKDNSLERALHFRIETRSIAISAWFEAKSWPTYFGFDMNEANSCELSMSQLDLLWSDYLKAKPKKLPTLGDFKDKSSLQSAAEKTYDGMITAANKILGQYKVWHNSGLSIILEGHKPDLNKKPTQNHKQYFAMLNNLLLMVQKNLATSEAKLTAKMEAKESHVNAKTRLDACHTMLKTKSKPILSAFEKLKKNITSGWGASLGLGTSTPPWEKYNDEREKNAKIIRSGYKSLFEIEDCETEQEEPISDDLLVIDATANASLKQNEYSGDLTHMQAMVVKIVATAKSEADACLEKKTEQCWPTHIIDENKKQLGAQQTIINELEIHRKLIEKAQADLLEEDVYTKTSKLQDPTWMSAIDETTTFANTVLVFLQQKKTDIASCKSSIAEINELNKVTDGTTQLKLQNEYGKLLGLLYETTPIGTENKNKTHPPAATPAKQKQPKQTSYFGVPTSLSNSYATKYVSELQQLSSKVDIPDEPKPRELKTLFEKPHASDTESWGLLIAAEQVQSQTMKNVFETLNGNTLMFTGNQGAQSAILSAASTLLATQSKLLSKLMSAWLAEANSAASKALWRHELEKLDLGGAIPNILWYKTLSEARSMGLVQQEHAAQLETMQPLAKPEDTSTVSAVSALDSRVAVLEQTIVAKGHEDTSTASPLANRVAALEILVSSLTSSNQIPSNEGSGSNGSAGEDGTTPGKLEHDHNSNEDDSESDSPDADNLASSVVLTPIFTAVISILLCSFLR